MSLLNPIENITTEQNVSEAEKKDQTKTFRVPLFKKQDMFIIWTGSGTVRYFQQDTLPDVIKVKLGIIMASPHAADLNTKEMSNTDFEQSNVQSEVYISKFGKDYEDIGWQYNRYYYCVVLTDKELASLQE